MNKLFLLDAYALIYRAYYAFIRSPRINSKGMNTSAIFGFVNTLEDVLKTQSPTHIGVAFDPSGPTFRHEAYPEYKAQRDETPEGIKIAVPYIKRLITAYNIPILEVNGYEADDVIGTLATLSKDLEDTTTYMMTPDKDYAQLVGKNVYMFKPKSEGKTYEILGEAEVCAKYGLAHPTQVIDMLGLMGDTADNIPGCPGVGEKTAVKLLTQFGSAEGIIENVDSLKGALKTKIEANKDKITFSKYLATIKTDVPISLDMESLKVKDKNKEELKDILEELEFRTLIPKILDAPKAAPATAIQGSLFDDFSAVNPAAPQEEQKNEPYKTLEDSGAKYHLVENESDIDFLASKILTSAFVSLDTETTSTDAVDAELVGLSFSIAENEAFYVPVPADRDQALTLLNKFKKVYESEETLKVGQNIKYDLTVLSNYGIELKGRMFDTMIAHYLLHPELRHNMDYLAEVYLHYKTIHIDELIGSGRIQRSMRDLAPEEVYKYAAEDADVTLKLYNIFKDKLVKENLIRLFEDIEMPLVPVLAQMEKNGVCVDTGSLAEVSAAMTRRMTEIESEIHEMAGKEFNISSPRQVGEVLFEDLKVSGKAKKTKTGQYTTSEEVLQGLKSKHPIVGKILDYRSLKKLLSTYIDALPQLISKRTGHIHTSYNQAVTTTGRLSSSKPNLQNIPIRDEDGKEVRKAFIPEEGCKFFSADYSQIELRLIAHLSGDENMIEAFREGHDIHAATAAKIFKKPIEEISHDERRKAKTANFGIIYGISAFGLAERLEVSRSEARELIDSYFDTYPGVKRYMEQSVERARRDGRIATAMGRLRYLPDINSRNATVRGYAERNAVNAPIQGTAADIIKLAMIRIDRRMQEERLTAKMILQVHDELNFSVPPEELPLLRRIVVEEMEHAFTMTVPLIADCGEGSNWLEAH